MQGIEGCTTAPEAGALSTKDRIAAAAKLNAEA
jgi:hypothetical protein